MIEKAKFKEAYNIIENLEINSRVRQIQDNSEKLKCYWEIGKLIDEANRNEESTYGKKVIEVWSEKLTKDFGKFYGKTNLKYMKQFYLRFPKKHILHAKSPDKQKSHAAHDRYEDMIKDPIFLKTSKNITKLNEKTIHKLIIEMLEERFLELGTGFNLTWHEYKIKVGDRTYKIDLLFFNTELNCYVVVEAKISENKPKDIGQLELYTKYIDQNLKKSYHNKTIGLLLVKRKNKILVEYITKPNIFITKYELINL